MTTSEETKKKPLWLLIEENILELDSQDLAGENLEASIQRIAGQLDNTGYNVSRHGGNMLQLRWAINETRKVGRPLMKDFNAAIAALSLEDVADPYAATNELIGNIGETWPEFKRSERRADVIRIVEKTKLDLLVAKAKGLPDDEGIRLLIEQEVAPEVITQALGISEEKFKQVTTEMEKERAERARVTKLLEAVEGKPDEKRIQHLLSNDVSDELIKEMAEVDQAAVESAKKAIEEKLKQELEEKQKREAEEAARKEAEAEGPSLEEIPPDQILEYIEGIREILEFSDQEKDIRIMCEQSSIPKALVDIAVSQPDRLDELEKEAEG